MRIISPKIEIEKYDPIKIMKNIERACRTCYRSEDTITEESYKNLIKNCINRGHESVLEHEKITIRMTCDIGVYKDLTRHRAGTAFSIESTRYCAYNRDKFGGEITYIEPLFFESRNEDDETEPTKNQILTMNWFEALMAVENSYLAMREAGAIPDECRMILPHSTAAQVTMTCNIREWRHILKLRAAKFSHPAIQQLLIPLLLNFKENMPELFNDIEYNEDFPKEKYAKISYMED